MDKKFVKHELITFSILLGTALTIGIVTVLVPDVPGFPALLGGIIAAFVYELCSRYKGRII
jgi:hypothetical protein